MPFRLSGILARRAEADARSARGARVIDPDHYEFSDQVYGLTDEEILAELDDRERNTCTDPGGHVWLRGTCVHCGDPAP